ncbi:leucine-rich repeat protein [Ruminococcus sp.]|uniref:leucine-rich repeat protein n=1 Tax=Ruminococcus sp. TaxID=41978 RepID=UPI0025D5122E|nr:leucine-rich repeat protein [Ruminococcus sp.]MCR4639248.1 leucine-rich repeat protein [Ruminococcus sp.]
MLKKVFSGILSLAICSSLVTSLGTSSGTNSAKNEITKSDYELTGSNSLGKYLTQMSNQQQNLADIKADTALYSVSSLDFNAETGDISICSSQTTDCNINVIITDEISGETAYTKAFPVARGEYVATNEKLENVKLPEYFIVKAYLSDKKGKKISNEFVLNKYTKEMQEILTADIHDFPEAQVINFDESEETNFIVLNEDTVKAETTEDENILVSADYDSNVFVFENADPEIVSIEYGQYLYIQPNEDDIIAVAVDSVETDGNITTVTGLDQDIDDMFDFIKIEQTEDEAQMNVDTSDMDEDFEVVGHEDETEFTLPADAEIAFRNGRKRYNASYEYSSNPSLDIGKGIIGKLVDNLDDKLGNADLSGTIGFEIKLNFYKKFTHINVTFSITPKVVLSASFTFGAKTDKSIYDAKPGELANRIIEAHERKAEDCINKEIKLLHLSFTTPIPGVLISTDPRIEFELSGSITISIEFSHTYGFELDNKEKFDNGRHIRSIGDDSESVSKPSIQGEGKVAIRFVFDPKMNLIHKKIASIGLKASLGLELTLGNEDEDGNYTDSKWSRASSNDAQTVFIYESDEEKLHGCNVCLTYRLALVCGLSCTATIIGFDFELPVITRKFGIASFHISDHCGMEAGGCNYYKYKTTFHVIGESGYPLVDAKIDVDGITVSTDGNGYASVFCDNGSHPYTITAYSEKVASGTVNVENAPQTIEENLKETKDDDGNIKYSHNKTSIDSGTPIVTTTYVITTKPYVTSTLPVNPQYKVLASGALGEHIGYHVYGDGTMLITGYGDMDDSLTAGAAKNAIDKVTQVIFEPCVPDTFDLDTGERTTKDVAEKDIIFTSIGNGLFKNCTNLKSITYEGSPNEGKVAVDIPPTITKIGDSAFENCRSLPFGDYKVHDGVTEVGAYAFGQCHQLTSCTLPQSVEKIGSGAFNKCMNLKKLSLPFAGATRDTAAGTLIYQLFNIEGAGLGGKFDSEYEDKFIHHGFCSMGPDDTNESIWAPNHVSAIPFELKEIEITGGDTIPENAFAYCSFLDKITLSDSIENIGVNAFFGCNNITELNLTDNIKTIGNGAFRECSKLKTLHISKNLETINGRTFAYCSSLDNIKIPGTVQGIGDTAFIGCVSLQHFEIENGIKSIGTRAFQECHSIKKLVIPTSVEKIGHTIINKCESLEELSIPFIGSEPGLKKANFIYSLFDYEGANQGGKFPAQYEDRFIHHGYNRNDPDNDYGGCIAAIPFNFKRVELTGGDIVPEVGFAECSFLDEIILPEGIKSINYYDFWYCSGLKKLYIPESVTEISGSVFRGTNLTIYGKKGSYAEEYATKNNIKFVEYGSDDYKIEHITAEKAVTGTTTVTTTVTTTKTTTTTTTTSKTSTTTAPKTSTTTSSTPAAVTVRGDANGDGELDMSDAVLIMQALANPNKYGVTGTSPTHITSAGFKSADTDGNGLTVNDALRIQKYLLGLIKSFD